MKFVVDVCLSTAVVEALSRLGHEVVHWSTIGEIRAKDETIMAWCATHGYVIITADTDFGHLLAKLKDTTPSVMILRTSIHSASVVVPLIHSTIERFSAELMDGCLISVDEIKARIRRLPIE